MTQQILDTGTLEAYPSTNRLRVFRQVWRGTQIIDQAASHSRATLLEQMRTINNLLNAQTHSGTFAQSASLTTADLIWPWQKPGQPFDLLTVYSELLDLAVRNVAALSSIAIPDEHLADERLTIEDAVIRAFGYLPHVVAIYSDTFRAELTFKVFIDSETYSDELMEALLDREIQLLTEFPKRPMGFRYIPLVLSEPHRDGVRDGAKLIYEA